MSYTGLLLELFKENSNISPPFVAINKISSPSLIEIIPNWGDLTYTLKSTISLTLINPCY